MSRTNDVNIAMQYAKSGVDGVHLMDSHKATIGWVVNTLAAEVERLEELHNLQLAGISTACLQNTEKSAADRITRDNPYWTVAYGDVCTAIDREMRERKRAEAAEARVKELEAVRQDLLGKIVGWQDGHREDQERIAKLRAALKSLQSDAQCTIDLYNKNGPTWTSRDSGAEYYDASYVIDSAEERIATIKAALADTKGTT